MICTAISEKNFETCTSLLEKVEFAEIRLDLTGFNREQVKKIFSSGKDLIATCRPTIDNKHSRQELLAVAIESGATYVDLEVETDQAFIGNLRSLAKKHGCKLIISYHNFLKTPAVDELKSIVNKCFDAGADIAKIACMVNEIKDNARLLGILDEEKPVVTIGMGELGKITRIATPFLGAPFTFASLTDELQTAPGQIQMDMLKNIIDMIKNN